MKHGTLPEHRRPDAVPVTAADVPRLFGELARLRALGRTPRLQGVLVDDQLEAGVWRTPRLGLPWRHHLLVVGYPLLAALSPEEMRAVLAHELAHLALRHGRAHAWFLRGRSTREQELEADRFAALATSPRVTADALVASRLARAALERGWLPALRRAPARHELPPENHLADMEPELLRDMSGAGAREALRRALRERSGPRDTHPSLPERLAALGEDPRVPPRPARSAAEVLLGEALPRIRAELERRWREAVAPRWAEAHASALGRAARLAELEMRAATGPLPAEEALERVGLVEDLRGPDEALPAARAAVAAAPDLARAHLALGRLLLAAGDLDGLAHVEHAIALDADAAAPAVRLLEEFHRTRDEGGDGPWGRHRARTIHAS